MKKNIQFLSASDRLNYGDLLFPIITKTVLSNYTAIDFKNYALIKSDLSSFGAMPTKSYKKLELENNKNSIIIIGGGHVMFSQWNTLYGHINKFYLNSKKNKVFNWIYPRFNFPRILFTKSKTISPFAPYHLQGKLVYLSVGGNYVNHESDINIRAMLQSTALLSVRDEMLYDQLVQYRFNVFKVPDTAILISKLFPIEDLVDKISNKLDFKINEKYIIIQIGLHKGPIDKKSFVHNINIFKNMGFKILCMPIGLAADHEDYKTLKQIMKLDKDWEYYYPSNIYEIMYLIAKADWFLGTSLHGCITAFSYNTPFIPLNKKVKKLDNYTKTWWATFIKNSIDYDDLHEFINEKTKEWNSDLAKNQLKLQQDLVMENYERLQAVINQNLEE